MQNWGIYIRKVVRRAHPDKNMSKSGTVFVNRILDAVAREIIYRARFHMDDLNQKTMSAREIRSAVLSIFSNELATLFDRKGFDAIVKAGDPTDPKPEGPTRREHLAGLVFPISRAENVIRSIYPGIRVGWKAPFYFSTVLEMITETIMKKAGDITTNENRTTIFVRDISAGVSNDTDLSRLFKTIRLSVPRLAVLNILTSFLKDRKARDPAIKHIKELQKSSAMIFQHEPIDRSIRAIAIAQKEGVRLTKGLSNIIQEFAENEGIRILRAASKIAAHVKHETLLISDLKLAIDLLDVTTETPGDEVELSTAGCRKLATRAGFPRVSEAAIDLVRQIISASLRSTIKVAVFAMDHRRAKTLTESDFAFAVKSVYGRVLL
jgi:histone H3/H4